MTQDCFSRHYRPPEIIIGYKDYDFKADIWSFGCVVSELLRYHLKSSISKKKSSGPLFKGTHCILTSPEIRNKKEEEKESKTIITKNDQMVLILRTLGKDKKPSSAYSNSQTEIFNTF